MHHIQQDLHIHTTYSVTDTAVVKEQTVDLIAQIRHADVIGISDHLDSLLSTDDDSLLNEYIEAVQRNGFRLGTEIDGGAWVDAAKDYPFEYFYYHCRDNDEDYRGLERLLSWGKPVVVAHPNLFHTDVRKTPTECYIEISNKYVWRTDWRSYYRPFLKDYRFVLGSDAHQPHWLNHTVCAYAAEMLGVSNTLIFSCY